MTFCVAYAQALMKNKAAYTCGAKACYVIGIAFLLIFPVSSPNDSYTSLCMNVLFTYTIKAAHETVMNHACVGL